MSTSHLERRYTCWNDCVPQGCFGHVASVDFQSVSDALTFDDGRGQQFHIQTPELDQFIAMLKELAEYRVEIHL